MLNWLKRLLMGDNRARDLMAEARRGSPASPTSTTSQASHASTHTATTAANQPLRPARTWGPGFWGGLMAGGLLGSWFGTAAHARHEHEHAHDNRGHDGSPPLDPDIWRGAGPGDGGGGGSFDDGGGFDGGGDGDGGGE
jgi:hypothetical protein